ncbi:MAG: heat-inducible transcription repressor HrcA [Acidobacteria bacterium]|nr:heat-inducible transcription repressor HrcA [Acidobacteriota bacterium]
MAEKDYLDQRQKGILYFIIRAYSESGIPVGSRFISKQYADESLSSATIRNVMADLEELGLLEQPHVSAGRVPSDKAYRLMVGDIINSHRFSFPMQREIESELKNITGDSPTFFQALPTILSNFTGNIGMVLLPRFDEIKIRNLKFVKINKEKVIAVFVSNEGRVQNKLIDVESEYTQDQLDRLSNIVREKFQGMSIHEMLTTVKAMLAEQKNRYDILLSEALELSRKSLEHSAEDSIEIYHSGTDRVIQSINQEKYDQLLEIYRTFEDKTKLYELLARCLNTDGLNVIIGNENEIDTLKNFSIVSAPYGQGEKVLGSIAVLGPKRMDYYSALGVVYYSTKLINNLLAKSGF